MVNNILIISSDHTGHGHKSITESLCEKFPDSVNIHVVDGFSLGGRPLIKVGKSYGSITRNMEGLWEIIYDISANKPSLINEIVEMTIKVKFLKLIRKINPDLILSVHPNFNGSILNILEKNRIRIPVITLIADLVSITPLWADNRADYIISPTKEAKEKCISYGVDEKKIKVLGFPVRSRFHGELEEQSFESKNDYTLDKPLKCLIMSGGEGVGNMKKIAQILLNNFNCTVSIVAGRNKALRKKLELSLNEKYGDRVKVYGFLENVEELMLESDIAFTRGSPNVMMEVVSCNIPLVITGCLPGQEEGNPAFAESNNLGVVCYKVRNLHSVMEDLLKDDAKKLNEIKHAQKKFCDKNTAKNITDFIMNNDFSSDQYNLQQLVEKLV